MASLVQWAGGAFEAAITADFNLSPRVRIQRITSQSGAPDLILPDARRFWSTGGPVLGVWNTSGADLAIVDNAGGAVVTVGNQQLAKLFLIEQANAAGVWIAKVDATDGVPVAGANDFMFTFGGDDAAYQSQAWQYDHTGNVWAAQSNSPSLMFGSNGFLSGGIAYLQTSAAGFAMMKYDPDVWTTLGAGPRSPNKRANGTYDGRGEFYCHSTTTTHDRYVIGTDTFSVGTAYPQAVTLRSGVIGADLLADDAILVHGGLDNFRVRQAQARVHTPSTDTYASKANMPTARDEHAHFALGGDVFVVGGINASGFGTIGIDIVESYELAGDAWTTRAVYSRGANSRMAATTRSAGVSYVVGGSNPTANTGASYQVDTWSAIADHASSGAAFRGANNSTFAPNV